MRRAGPDAASNGAAVEVMYGRVHSLVVGPVFLACGPAGRIAFAVLNAAIPPACIVKRRRRRGRVPKSTLPRRRLRFPCLQADLPRSRYVVGVKGGGKPRSPADAPHFMHARSRIGRSAKGGKKRESMREVSFPADRGAYCPPPTDTSRRAQAARTSPVPTGDTPPWAVFAGIRAA